MTEPSVKNLARVNVPRLSDAIVRQIESMILEGSLKAGDALPPERALAEQFGVSRPSLREAIQKLAARGLLVSRQGGGTYVSDQLEASFSSPWQSMVASHPELRRDVLEFRRLLEGTSARMAAERATDTDIQRLREVVARLQSAHAAHDLNAVSRADTAFHQAIADAAHNAMFTHVLASLFSMMRTHVHDNIANLFAQGTVSGELLEQHLAIWRCIEARDPAGAQAAAEAHIDFVERVLIRMRDESEREARAARRGAALGGVTPDPWRVG
jgi:GntR family transcriptional repressor for pyruvate dehydrogenase complex